MLILSQLTLACSSESLQYLSWGGGGGGCVLTCPAGATRGGGVEPKLNCFCEIWKIGGKGKN